MCQTISELKKELNVRPKRPKALTEEERKTRVREYQREYQKKRRENNLEAKKRHTELCRIHNIYAKKAVAYCKAKGITFDDDDE